ncbi:3D domain-containing protein [Sporolactobacillus terrae]|uniref:3D domain-containing protein n=1 Tax=Sporolactobacillus terrae TaxID=269673 RepID=UPI0011192D3F|nr:3D domain-containing protein [Sporolactobacillus terrae]
MNIIKRLTAMTSLAVCFGVITPTTIALAKTGSTNDSHAYKSKDPKQSQAIGFAANTPALQSDSQEINIIFGNSLIQQGDSGPIVEKLQEELQKLGYYDGEDHGVVGESTLSAVSAFETDSTNDSKELIGAGTKTVLYTVYRHTSEAKENQEGLVTLKIQKKKQAKMRARKAAEEKAKKIAEEAARKAAEKEAKEQAQKEAERAADTNKPRASKTSAQPAQAPKSAPAEQAGRSITVEATSYSLGGRSATGIDFSSNPNAKVIAVDPKVIPLGSKVKIPGYGVFVAGDTGGAIKGKRIDVHFPSRDQALQFGRRTLTVTVLN